jgi:hypothetical protein
LGYKHVLFTNFERVIYVSRETFVYYFIEEGASFASITWSAADERKNGDRLNCFCFGWYTQSTYKRKNWLYDVRSSG